MNYRHIQIQRDPLTDYGELQVAEGVVLGSNGTVHLVGQFVVYDADAVDFELPSGVHVQRDGGARSPLRLAGARASLHFVYVAFEWYQIDLIDIGIADDPTPAEILDEVVSRVSISAKAVFELLLLALLSLCFLYAILQS